MPEEPIPKDVLLFIADHIRSVEQLEILCLLVETPDRAWSTSEIFRTIQSTEKSVLDGVQYFMDHGVVSQDAEGLFRFNPEAALLKESVLRLVRTYRERRVTIIETIYKKPLFSVQDFAEAFRLRKEK